jgi:hypothetical protein
MCLSVMRYMQQLMGLGWHLNLFRRVVSGRVFIGQGPCVLAAEALNLVLRQTMKPKLTKNPIEYNLEENENLISFIPRSGNWRSHRDSNPGLLRESDKTKRTFSDSRIVKCTESKLPSRGLKGHLYHSQILSK